MEHQVFLPVPADLLRAALADPARVARSIPGLQQDAGADPVAGRLKLRVGGHSVTYRGALRVTAREDGTYAVEGDATESRGPGAVKIALTLRLADTDGGTTVTVDGTADADGRLAELPADAVGSAATRLLDRFLEALASSEPPPEPGTTPAPAPAPAPEPPHTSVFETEIPPPSLDPDTDDDTADGTDNGTDNGTDDGTADNSADSSADRTPQEAPIPGDFADTGEPPAEAAHARRTMIGRSAEEVDHAPPRGRYAPVPAPQTVASGQVLRWAAPAAALALASAIVVSRALRKRR
ncbi:SRPBCC family protein [Streptomyces sp. NPDC048297]|uniref:SRPBCC family protein n=1 Tax=Streptomyces sp. NPDC048297 TaxID=3365531 RepID=UPI003720E2DB